MKTFLSALTLLSVSSSAMATVIADYQFNTAADTEEWTAFLNVTGLTADGDSLNGTASSNDPQLRINPTVALSRGASETWDTLVFRVREIQDEAPAGPVSGFDATGLIVQANIGISTVTINSGFSAVASGDDFFTVTVDISSIAAQNIQNLRLDPIGGASSNSNSQTQDNTFEIDFITVNSVPEPSIALLGGLGLLGLLRRRRA